VLVWASKSTPWLRQTCSEGNISLLHMEDGFLRSRGLGSRHIAPASLVIDRRGIYYDATRPSDLEHLLQHGTIGQDRVAEAGKLRRLVVERGLSKYNVGGRGTLTVPADKRAVLVVGQVGDDASIKLGTGEVASNLSLLRQVRADHPGAYLIYKPHPDVEFGRRAGWIAPHQVLQYADYIAADLAADQAILQVDEVCVMTSLLGFEAVLRSKPVTCYGMPFYAGWGITNDKMSNSRRGRKRSVDEVLAAAYLLYARYIDTATGRPADAFAVAQALIG
jgi:capsular polysaccharide export protein